MIGALLLRSLLSPAQPPTIEAQFGTTQPAVTPRPPNRPGSPQQPPAAPAPPAAPGEWPSSTLYDRVASVLGIAPDQVPAALRGASPSDQAELAEHCECSPSEISRACLRERLASPSQSRSPHNPDREHMTRPPTTSSLEQPKWLKGWTLQPNQPRPVRRRGRRPPHGPRHW